MLDLIEVQIMRAADAQFAYLLGLGSFILIGLVTFASSNPMWPLSVVISLIFVGLIAVNRRLLIRLRAMRDEVA